jgi:hypothetical protein
MHQVLGFLGVLWQFFVAVDKTPGWKLFYQVLAFTPKTVVKFRWVMLVNVGQQAESALATKSCRRLWVNTGSTIAIEITARAGG